MLDTSAGKICVVRCIHEEDGKAWITYEVSEPIKQIAIVDLNERNLLAKDNHLLDSLVTKMVELLSGEHVYNPFLQYNLGIRIFYAFCTYSCLAPGSPSRLRKYPGLKFDCRSAVW
jgi:hypothetical protein